MKGIWILASLFFAACTSAQQKSPTQWKVKATTESQKKIWVTKADGSRQCGKNLALSPDLAAQQLKAAGILVFDSRAGDDGQMHAQKCGAPTGGTVEAEISQLDLTKALRLGYVSKSTESP